MAQQEVLMDVIFRAIAQFADLIPILDDYHRAWFTSYEHLRRFVLNSCSDSLVFEDNRVCRSILLCQNVTIVFLLLDLDSAHPNLTCLDFFFFWNRVDAFKLQFIIKKIYVHIECQNEITFVFVAFYAKLSGFNIFCEAIIIVLALNVQSSLVQYETSLVGEYENFLILVPECIYEIFTVLIGMQQKVFDFPLSLLIFAVFFFAKFKLQDFQSFFRILMCEKYCIKCLIPWLCLTFRILFFWSIYLLCLLFVDSLQRIFSFLLIVLFCIIKLRKILQI